jgi:hypothetical protein
MMLLPLARCASLRTSRRLLSTRAALAESADERASSNASAPRFKNIRVVSSRQVDVAAAPDSVAPSATVAAAPAAAPGKRKKSAGAPKSPQSAYLFYMSDAFAALRKRIGGKVSVTDIARAVAQQWAALSAEQRAPFEQLAEADSKRYYAEKAEYEATLPPKRALSAYSFFVVEQRTKILEANPQLSFADVGRELGRRWNELPSTHPLKLRYEDLARSDRLRFADEKSRFDKGQ